MALWTTCNTKKMSGLHNTAGNLFSTDSNSKIRIKLKKEWMQCQIRKNILTRISKTDN
jgi:hypothetical protein